MLLSDTVKILYRAPYAACQGALLLPLKACWEARGLNAYKCRTDEMASHEFEENLCDPSHSGKLMEHLSPEFPNG